MGIREFYAQHMDRPGYEYVPDPLGRLGQGQWIKTAQGPDAPTPPRSPTVPKPVPPIPPKGASRKTEGRNLQPRSFRRLKLKNGRIIDQDGNQIPFKDLSKDERIQIFREKRADDLKQLFD